MTKPHQQFTVRPVKWDGADGNSARAIRMEVFVAEQHCDPANEVDSTDTTAQHFVAFNAAGQPCGTARLFADGDAPDTARIGRMAVLRSHRGTGCGAALMDALVVAARQLGFQRAKLSAQSHAEEFYARWGFEAYGDIYDDEGIPHRMMSLNLA